MTVGVVQLKKNEYFRKKAFLKFHIKEIKKWLYNIAQNVRNYHLLGV
jgi:hypothetical protein